MQCPFEVLGLDKTASSNEIDNRYKELILKWHPDKGHTSDPHQAQIIIDARNRAKEMCNRSVHARKIKQDHLSAHKRKFMGITRYSIRRQISSMKFKKLKTRHAHAKKEGRGSNRASSKARR
jgi:hypothetical protein